MDRRIFLAAAAVATMAGAACGTTQRSAGSHGLSLLETSGTAAEPAIFPQQAVTYVLDGPLADLGPSAEVRTLIGHNVTAADLARMSGALGMHGVPQRSSTGWELRNGDAVLTVSTDGGATAVDYSTNGGAVAIPGSTGAGATGSGGSAGSSNSSSTAVSSPPMIPAVAPPPTAPATSIVAPVDVPSNDQALGIAQSLLDNLGVLAGQDWSHEVSDAGGVAVACSTAAAQCTPVPAVVTARLVTYQLIVAGASVPDVSWSVTIGEHRIVEAVSGTWALPVDAGSYPLRSTQKVFDDLRTGNARYAGPQPLSAVEGQGAPATPGVPPAVVVHITGVSLGMASWNGLENGQPVVYLLPTYRFHAEVSGGSPYDIELLALDPGMFTFVAPPTLGGSSGGVVPVTFIAGS